MPARSSKDEEKSNPALYLGLAAAIQAVKETASDEKDEEELMDAALRQAERGYFFSEAAAARDLIAALKSASTSNKRYAIALLAFLGALRKPLISELSNSEARHSDEAKSLIQLACAALLSSDVLVKAEASYGVLAFLQVCGRQHYFIGNGSLENVIKALRIEIVKYFYAKRPSPQDGELMVTLASIIRELCKDVTASRLLCRAGALGNAVEILERISDFRHPSVSVIVDALWNALNLAVKSADEGADVDGAEDALCVLGNEHSIRVLTSLFERFLEGGYRAIDKDIRNDVVLISSLLARRRQNHHLFHTTGYFSLLLLYSTAPEMELPTSSRRENFASSTDFDLELKQLMWHLVGTLGEFAQGSDLEELSSSLMMRTLVFYVDPNLGCSAESIKSKWSPMQLDTLHGTALSLMYSIYSKCQDAFERADGAGALMRFVQASSEKMEDVIGRRRLISALSLLRLVIASGGRSADGLCSSGSEIAITLIEICECPDATRDVKRHSMLVASALCAQNNVLKRTFRKRGMVPLLLACLEFQRQDYTFGQEYVMAVVNGVWNIVVGDTKSERIFVDEGGADYLLNTLERCDDRRARGQILGCLSDLVKNKVTPGYVLSWRSSALDAGAAEMVLSMWCEEERRFLKLTQGGAADPGKRPLESSALHSIPGSESVTREAMRDKRGESVTFNRLKDALAASREMSAGSLPSDHRGWRRRCDGSDLRVKIYSLLHGIGFSNIDKSPLSALQAGVLDLAEQYPALLEGQLWLEMVESMKEESLKPILADRMHVEMKTNESDAVIAQVRQNQTETLRGALSQEDRDDKTLFGLMKSRAIQEREEEERGPTPVFSQKMAMQMKKRRAVQSMIAKSRVVTPSHEQMKQPEIEEEDNPEA